MADQSKIQSIVQNLQGTHTQGQTNVPSSAQTGDPNSVYNWSTYLPTVGSANGRPTVDFDLLTSQAPASSPGYTPPFTADPYAAMVMSSMPRATENPVIANLLSGWGTRTQPPSGPGTGPGTPTTPTTPGPGTGPGTGPGPNTPWSGAGTGTPIGPISGPIDRDPNDWRNNYNNAQPNTNLNDSGLGRNTALPWAYNPDGTPRFSGTIGQPNNNDGSSQLMNTIRNLGTSLVGEARDQWNEFVDNVTFQNGWQGTAGLILDGFIPGASQLIEQLFPRGGPVDPNLVAQTNANLTAQLQGLMQQATSNQSGLGSQANNRLQEQMRSLMSGAINNSADQAGRLPEGWTTDTWSQGEWQDRQELMNFANLFNRSGGTGKNPITGMPSGSLIENMQNANLAQVMDFIRRMQERRGNIQR